MKKSLFLVAAAISAITVSTPANALNIILRDSQGSFAAQGARGQAALLSFQKAANFWNRTLTNNATINIDIGFANLGPNILGGARSSLTGLSVRDVYTGLASTGTTALDAVAVANLSPLDSNDALRFRTNAPLPGTTGGVNGNVTRFDGDGSINNSILAVNTANSKALGFGFDETNFLGCSASFASADGCIQFSTEFDFDFDPTDGITNGLVDFTGVAIHELGHVLGFVSGVDTLDFFAGNAGAEGVDFNDFALFSVFDLFRYGNSFDPITGDRLLQLSANRAAFFSINGSTPFNFGNPAEAEFANLATGQFVGDGNQASHFKDAAGEFIDDSGLCLIEARQIGILDPTAPSCGFAIVTSNDLAAFDAIGYNLNFDILRNPGFTFNTAQVFGLAGTAAVPEPATWAMMFAGFGMVGAATRRRRTRVKVSFA
jgi:PEP-CTERM motif